ncbi:twitching motility protein PilT [Cedecea sp. NFIX57]|nr:twitching motility protein PilT [Cedecea sp. NFIX57]
MDIEEIVALSVKHNVSDLHLCARQVAHRRKCGRLTVHPGKVPEVKEVLVARLSAEQKLQLSRAG